MAAANKVPDNLNYLSNISFRLTIEDAPNITWFCQSANVPGVSIEGIDVPTPTQLYLLLEIRFRLKNCLSGLLLMNI